MKQNDKLINATAFEKRLDNYRRDCEAEGDLASAQVFADCIAELQGFPPAEAASIVHAYWKKEIEDGMYWYACSNCGEPAPKTRYKTDLFSDYCPHCGAVMDADNPDEMED